MNLNDMQNLELTTTRAINAYCRVLELHMKGIEQGANPLATGQLGDIVAMATSNLKLELEFLSFIREQLRAMGHEPGSQGDS